ncbi:follistatin-A-like isoform X6 [Acropora muricata]|uniref:follistatin-A-like isoform X6 n=1 Tax=Acropora muricata TaxID=159855 RepID=UPI0034E39789
MVSKGIKPALFFFAYVVVVYTIQGASRPFCFDRAKGNICRGRPIRPSPNRNGTEDCCLEPNAMYYTNISLRIFHFLVGADCYPCNPTANPCKRKVCPSGRVCIDKGNGRAKCACTGCRDAMKRPVCGTNGKTYQHECDLKRKACRERRPDIEVAYDGRCKIGCDQVVCRKNRSCMVDHYKKAYCVQCPECSTHHNKSGPVCGADGLQYESSCHLRRESCRQGKAIGVAYRGRCIENATCRNINCGTGNQRFSLSWIKEKRTKKECVQDEAGRPRCVTCSCENIDPKQRSEIICGTDNNTYSNLCKLREQMCKKKKFVDVKSLSSCKVDGAGLPNEQPAAQPTPTTQCAQEDWNMYYILLRDFVDILITDFGLNVTHPNYQQLPDNQKVVLAEKVRTVLSQKWSKVTVHTAKLDNR